MTQHSLTFQDLALPEALLRAVSDAGYEAPSPIQAECIPKLLAGRDLIGQAQTGTGKTAAFALPLLARMDTANRSPQLLVLTPTRELAIQVAEACQVYARHMQDFHVLPIYGGQNYGTQLRQLRHGAQVIIGTPGRVMDHMRRGTLKLDQLQALVLDEADEMLRMGFIDDVEWVLQNSPDTRQIALFSATMPKVIQDVAARHLKTPELVHIKTATATVESIEQSHWIVSGLHKLDALTRVLESEPFDGVIVFVRTKTATLDLAEKLSARGYACEALNGDVAQNHRERIIQALKEEKTDILVATDVVARGLDVPRISHVINYDMPYDTESYIHRIGRTGRAGRKGKAILFVSPRERRMLKAIQNATRQFIDAYDMPSVRDLNAARRERFKQRIDETLSSSDLSVYLQLVSEYENDTDTDPLQIAAALAQMAQCQVPLFIEEQKSAPKAREPGRQDARPAKEKSAQRDKTMDSSPKPLKDFPDVEMERFRIEVGHTHGVKPANIVGAIANEAEIDSCYIGNIEIFDDFSTVDLPAGMPRETFKVLRKTRVCQRCLDISSLSKPKQEKNRQDSPAVGGKTGKGTDNRAGKKKVRKKVRAKHQKPKKRSARKQGGDQAT